jgi:farnesyl-diphosphate farnesyltransferase
MKLYKNAFEVLKETSRTFYIPISILPNGLKEAVASAYLCMRAIDEIEDHVQLDNSTKVRLLKSISLALQSSEKNFNTNCLKKQLNKEEFFLPEVTLRVQEWAVLAPESIAPRIWDATAAMADRMAYWAERNWLIETKADLDAYTFSVAGAVGLLLSDLWAWYDGTQTNRLHAIAFGRGLQTVNILRNQKDDLDRGVSFFPENWTRQQMDEYARYNLKMADLYTNSLPPGPAKNFCQIPLALAHGTIKAMSLGQEKLTRLDVMKILDKVS